VSEQMNCNLNSVGLDFSDPSENHVNEANNTKDEFLIMLGGRVRQHRHTAQMSRRVLAKRADVSERYLAQFECGKGNMSIGLLRKVSIALDVPLDQLVTTRSSK